MTGVQLPDGGKAWFVRQGKRRHCGLKPVSLEGRLLTIFYASLVSALSLFFANGDPGQLSIAAWIVLILAATFLYIVTALRMSARAPARGE